MHDSIAATWDDVQTLHAAERTKVPEKESPKASIHMLTFAHPQSEARPLFSGFGDERTHVLRRSEKSLETCLRPISLANQIKIKTERH